MNNHRNPLCEFAESCVLYSMLDNKLLDYCHDKVEDCRQFKFLYRQKRCMEKHHDRVKKGLENGVEE